MERQPFTSWPWRIYRPCGRLPRAPVFVGEPDDRGAVPLLWLNNVRPMSVLWPLTIPGKPQYIAETAESNRLLVPSHTYVLLRRFTAKEERRRLTAAVVSPRSFPGTKLGLENHLNYIYRRHGHLSPQEALGLAILLSSSLVDRYFRISNGNTQVNATELRRLPLPPVNALQVLGAQPQPGLITQTEIDEHVADVLRVPQELRRRLHELNNGQA